MREGSDFLVLKLTTKLQSSKQGVSDIKTEIENSGLE